jgi:hypothetical protein
MSTEEELGSQIPVDAAAAAILQIAFNSQNYSSGLFYRDCLVIPW